VTRYGVVGAGRMGLALARAIAATGEPVLVARTRPGPTAGLAPLDQVCRECDVVLLAVPFPVALALLSGPTGRCGRGRTLVDATNPRLGRHAAPPPGGGPGAELLARAAPSWRVVKAFNTVPAAQVASGRLAGGPVSVPVAGEPAAKREVFALARRLGFEPVDAGGLQDSGEVESLAVLLSRISDAHGLCGRIGIHIVQTVLDGSEGGSGSRRLGRRDLLGEAVEQPEHAVLQPARVPLHAQQ